jgi:hypothetical protein
MSAPMTPQEAGKLGATVQARRAFRTRLNVALLALDDCQARAEGADLTTGQRRHLDTIHRMAGGLLRSIPEEPEPKRKRKLAPERR